MKIERILELLGLGGPAEDEAKERDKPADDALNVMPLQEEQKQKLESDMSILEDEDPDLEKRIQKEAEKTVVSAASDSAKRLHVIQMGRCPECGQHLTRHLFATVCEACGWNEFDIPRHGPVRVHLRNRPEPIIGDRAYLVRPDSVLVVKDEVVVARVNQGIVSWVEYGWTKDEIDLRHRQVVDQMTLQCGWCNQPCDPDKDGFHVAQVAFGSTQERHTFCADECYEAFRRMYPARVHRDCYERKCAECELCVKRYDDETDSLRLLAKDYLKVKKQV